MPRSATVELFDAEEAFQRLRVDDLRPLAKLLSSEPPTRKTELVPLLVRTMRNHKKVQALYDQLDELSKAAVREAVHDESGELDQDRFEAKYSRPPDFGTERSPKAVRLFLPDCGTIPSDLHAMLQEFVPEPDSITVASIDELPQRVKPAWIPWDQRGDEEADEADEGVPLRRQETERAALHDMKAVLRLVDSGRVGASTSTKRPSQAGMAAVAAILHSGDFYGADEADEYDNEPTGLAMRPFAWPLIVQAAGFAHVAGSKLELTAGGRKALTQPAHELIRTVWRKWLNTTLLDEFNRVSVIKGQGGKGGKQFTALAERRQAVAGALAEFVPGKWIALAELFRFIQASKDFNFQVTYNPWSLYICDPQYGSLGYDGHDSWAILQGRYVMAFLFEYAATLGLIDVAYIAPTGARGDYSGMWGTDDLRYLSRYDGLCYLRINPLGAWCLGQNGRYEPSALPAAEPVLKVLPNLDVAATAAMIAPGDRLFLDRFADHVSESVWRLTAAKCLAALEDGLSLTELREFLGSRSGSGLPPTVATFLDDLARRAGQLRDLGPARLVECADVAVAQLLANDRRLRGICSVAGDSNLVFRAKDETAFRRAIRELGYTLPPA